MTGGPGMKAMIRNPGQDLVREVGGGLDHPSRRARRADVVALAAERDQDIVAAG
jgi:hypothetical protein